MLYIPAGTYTLTARLWIKKSNIVIRGAGAGQTILYIPKSEPTHRCRQARPCMVLFTEHALQLWGVLQQSGSLAGLEYGHCSLLRSRAAACPPTLPAGLWDLYGKSKGSVSGGYVNWGAQPHPTQTALAALRHLTCPGGTVPAAFATPARPFCTQLPPRWAVLAPASPVASCLTPPPRGVCPLSAGGFITVWGSTKKGSLLTTVRLPPCLAAWPLPAACDCVHEACAVGPRNISLPGSAPAAPPGGPCCHAGTTRQPVNASCYRLLFGPVPPPTPPPPPPPPTPNNTHTGHWHSQAWRLSAGRQGRLQAQDRPVLRPVVEGRGRKAEPRHVSCLGGGAGRWGLTRRQASPKGLELTI